MSIADLFGPQGPQRQFTEAERAQIAAYKQAVREYGVWEREQTLAWTPVFCTCARWRVPVSSDTPPGHAMCLVHGAFMITHDGRVI